jgi:hypothetical protein
MNINTKITLISPEEYLLLAKQHGISRNKAIALSGLSTRSWANWQYQKNNNPSLRSLLRLTRVVIEKGWV